MDSSPPPSLNKASPLRAGCKWSNQWNNDLDCLNQLSIDMSSQERQLPQTLVKTFDLSLKNFFSGYLKVCGLFSCVEKSNTEVNTPTQMFQQIYASQKYPWRKLIYICTLKVYIFILQSSLWPLLPISRLTDVGHSTQTPSRQKNHE